jgi:hypothetical protein
MNKTQTFKLWLEYNPFDVAEPDLSDWDMENEFCNIGVDLLDGRYYGINVWTYKYVETAIAQDSISGENPGGNYITPPDLLVKDLTKECIEGAITDLLNKGDLEHLLNPSVFNIRFKHPWTDADDISDHGVALEKELQAAIPADHILYNRGMILLGLRNDNNEIALELGDGSIALVLKEDKDLQVISIFRNKEDLWKLKLRNDIADGKD